jgi:hypothetical protein
MLSLVRDCCEKFLSFSDDFWLVALLTEWSFEVGNRRKFIRAVRSFSDARIAQSTTEKLGKGVNTNFVDLVEREYPHLAPVRRNRAWRGIIPDFRFGPAGTGGEVIGEIKALYDFTSLKFYSGPVAYDREKLLRNRSTKFAGYLFQVVFFTQLPGYNYPPGIWSYPGPKGFPEEKHCGTRTASVVNETIDTQYQYLRTFLKEEPAWSALGENVKRLEMRSEDELAAISRRFKSVFRPDPGESWEFRPETHFARAAIGCAIWSY